MAVNVITNQIPDPRGAEIFNAAVTSALEGLGDFDAYIRRYESDSVVHVLVLGKGKPGAWDCYFKPENKPTLRQIRETIKAKVQTEPHS